LDVNSVQKAVENAAIVYNFAGLADVEESIHQPKETIEQNVIGNINILESLRDKPIELFVYASSAYAVSNKGSFYGISKLASEKVIEEYEIRHGLPCTIVRYGSLYGERADEHNGIYRIIWEALTEHKISYSGDGEEIREYIHAADAATLSVDIAEDNSFIGEHLILSGVERLKRKDLLHMIQEIINKDLIIENTGEHWEGHYLITPYSFQPKAAKKLVPNPFIDLGQGLTMCIQAIYEHTDGQDGS
jgi:UDP-glucose 4-epimerase